MRKAWYLFGVSLAVGLIYLLVGEIEFSRQQLDAIWEKFDLLFLGGLIALTLVHLWLSAMKWQLAVASTLPVAQRKKGFFFYYTTMGAMMSEFLPAHLSSTLVRGAALRIHHQVPVLKGSATSIFDQVFDVYVFALCAVASILYLLYDLTFTDWGLLTLTGLILGYIVLTISGKLIPTQIQETENILLQFANWLSDRKSVLTRLYLVSIIRFAVIVLRNVLILEVLATAITGQQIVIVSPLVQLSLLLALTPGSIGIVEWSWTGLLSLTAVTLSAGGIYALANRFASFIAITVIAIPTIMIGWLAKTRQ